MNKSHSAITMNLHHQCVTQIHWINNLLILILLIIFNMIFYENENRFFLTNPLTSTITSNSSIFIHIVRLKQIAFLYPISLATSWWLQYKSYFITRWIFILTHLAGYLDFTAFPHQCHFAIKKWSTNLVFFYFTRMKGP